MSEASLQRNTSRSHGYHRTAAEKDAEALRALQLKVLGWRDHEIGELMGLTRQTVSKRISYAIQTHGQATVAEYREIAAQRYESLIRAAMEDVTPENKYEAIKVAADLTAKFARLVGAEAPVQVEAQVIQVTEQEKELRDLLAQAERDEKVREGAIVGNVRPG